VRSNRTEDTQAAAHGCDRALVWREIRFGTGGRPHSGVGWRHPGWPLVQWQNRGLLIRQIRVRPPGGPPGKVGVRGLHVRCSRC
jgi:hypothetical protein